MASKFSFDDKAFKKMTKDIVKEAAKDEQKWMDDFARRHRGQTADQITPALKREWDRRGGTISMAEAREYATQISEGTRIEFRT
ncbi:MAG: hypothetical protein KBB39_07290 [Phycicoccus sp.]|nr:hypothetical protein [Phycicoccus sp.]